MIKTNEYKLMALRECAPPGTMIVADNPAEIWKFSVDNLLTSPMARLEVENFWVVWLNTRRRITGFVHVSTGILDTILIHPREVFRGSIVANAASIVMVHNHPSGDPTPSEADKKTTRELIDAGKVIKIEVLDHIILGHVDGTPPYISMREYGFFA